VQSIGILGLGTYLPPTVRTNDFWPDADVAAWRDRMAHRATSSEPPADGELSEGARRTLAAMAEYADDPFRGAVERRVMDSDMTTSDMEATAARDAMARAGVGPDDIDVILSQTPVPEHLMVNHACTTHRLLGLPLRCLAIATEAACNGFAAHVSLAQGLIASGQARRVLSVHSSAITRVHGTAEPHSAWWGDGAAAAVIGPVADGRGLLAASHRCDGTGDRALVLGVPGQRWWSGGGEVTTYAHDRTHTRAMMLGLLDRGRDVILDALGRAGLAASEVGFYAAHQSTAWLARVSAAHAGLERAGTLTTFPYLGHMNSVNVPFILAMGEREGSIPDGTVVSTFSGGLGETWSSLVFRWGR
jgi:3-oxoacyl-[acyl-carrier-protein] synthase-3